MTAAPIPTPLPSPAAASDPTPTPAWAAAVVLYLAGFGAALAAWLAAHGEASSPAAALAAATPTLAAAALALTGDAAAAAWRQRLLATALLAPLLQLLWLQTAALALAPVVVALHALLALAVHAAATTLAMERLGLAAPRPPRRLQFSWVTSLVLR